MSKKRQTAVLDDMGDPRYFLTTHAYDYYAGFRTPEHYHNEDQLLYAAKGVMTVRTPQGIWVVPPQRAVWIPAKIPHSTQMGGVVAMRTLWFKAKCIKSLPRHCQVLCVSSLLRELILHVCEKGKLSRRNLSHARLIEIILEQLNEASELPLRLSFPEDSRAKRVAEMVEKNPGSEKSLAEYAEQVGASKRTIERIFETETRLTFGKWRQQLRLLHAIERIANGEKIISVAMESGYSNPSAFTAMFRRQLGRTPKQYFQDHLSHEPIAHSKS